MKKTIPQQLSFWGANAVVMPLVGLSYLTISAEGLRQLMPVFATRLYKLALPGAGYLRNFDGFNRLDVSLLMSLALFAAVTLIWVRVFELLMDPGAFEQRRRQNPVLFYTLAGVIGVIVCGDLAIFYAGLSAKAASSWSDPPAYVAPLASVLYMAALALIGAWHADYRTSGAV